MKRQAVGVLSALLVFNSAFAQVQAETPEEAKEEMPESEKGELPDLDESVSVCGFEEESSALKDTSVCRIRHNGLFLWRQGLEGNPE